jgi:ribosome-binding protein aMBF1 (putative translation factor)
LGKRNRQSSGTAEADALLATIQKAREAAGVSQRELARRLNFHPTVLGKIERGERVLDVIEFVALAQALDIDPLELMGNYLSAVQQKHSSRSIESS